MIIDMDTHGYVYRNITIFDFLNKKYDKEEPTIEFIRDDAITKWNRYPPVRVKATIDGFHLPVHVMYGYSALRYQTSPSDEMNRYQLTKFELVIHQIDQPEYDVTVDVKDLSHIIIEGSDNLMDTLIEPVLDIVSDIITYKLSDYFRHINVTFRTYPFLKAILAGIIENPNLEKQLINIISTLTLDAEEKDNEILCFDICEIIHNTIHNYQLYEYLTTPMRTKLIQHFQEQSKLDIVAQLLNTATPMDPSKISKDPKWEL